MDRSGAETSTPLTSEAIKAQASTLGFDLCGVAPARAHPELGRLEEWLERGFAGEMSYMARTAARRADVRAVMPAAQAVIVLGTVYNTARQASLDVQDSGQALISRYAWGDDYHDVLGARTQELADWMHARHPQPFETRVYVDTGPIQERVYARHAGLGWIGKNTCLINPDLGSWLFLSEILCSVPLDVDTPAFDQCGSCTLCLDACPTGAFPEPGVLDSTRCLSYLTIEAKGAIPVAHREALGAHVYGCDICQDVCPYNDMAPLSLDPAWQPRPALDGPRLVDLWSRSDTELRAAIRGGPMTRARVKRLRRNIAVALGNSDDDEARSVLGAQSADQGDSLQEPLVVEHVDWARARLAEGATRHGRSRGGEE